MSFQEGMSELFIQTIVSKGYLTQKQADAAAAHGRDVLAPQVLETLAGFNPNQSDAGLVKQFFGALTGGNTVDPATDLEKDGGLIEGALRHLGLDSTLIDTISELLKGVLKDLPNQLREAVSIARSNPGMRPAM